MSSRADKRERDGERRLGISPVAARSVGTDRVAAVANHQPRPALPTQRHPAKFSATVLEAIAGHPLLPVAGLILDPFAGVGGVHKLATSERKTVGVELERPWAAAHPDTRVGDATALPGDWTGRFDAVATSPPYPTGMADYFRSADASKRNTYIHALRETLGPDYEMHPNNAARYGRGRKGKHWALIEKVWAEIHRVLADGGVAFINVSDHYEKGALVSVVDTHLQILEGLGFILLDRLPVVTPRNGQGANGKLRAEHEDILVLRRP